MRCVELSGWFGQSNSKRSVCVETPCQCVFFFLVVFKSYIGFPWGIMVLQYKTQPISPCYTSAMDCLIQGGVNNVKEKMKTVNGELGFPNW